MGIFNTFEGLNFIIIAVFILLSIIRQTVGSGPSVRPFPPFDRLRVFDFPLSIFHEIYSWAPLGVGPHILRFSR